MEDHQLSSSTINDDVLNTKKVCFIINVLYASFGFCFFFSFLVTLVIAPRSLGNDLIFSYFPRLKETSWAILFHFFTFMSFLFMVVFLTIVDVVPVMVYFHAAKMIEALKIRLESRLNENQVNNYEAIHPIWSHFEKLRVLIHRADNLFGPMIIFNHGVNFFIICAITFSILNAFAMGSVRNEFEQFPVYLIGLFFFAGRLLLTVHLMLEVHSSAEKLLSTLACLSTQHWKYFDEKGHRILHSFLCRLQNVQLAVCPSGFYKITPSILLTMLSLIISYTIILLQNK